ncbi:MAG: response regulator [SAR324 cluster bacterium]|nr:response regulator [SAR324 cluster bacterium]
MNKFRILIVDDEEEVRKSYRSILEPVKTSNFDQNASFLFEDLGENFITELDDLFEEESEILLDEDLEPSQYELIQASQGSEAVEAVSTSLKEEKPFSLVFLDIRMPPGIDGKKTARLIRQIDPFIEIVIMTAYSDYTFEEIVAEVGNPERLLFFHKPFTPKQIEQLALTLTQKWDLDRQSRNSQTKNQ